MTTNTTLGSATIYQFPIEVRKAAIQREQQARVLANLEAAPLAAVGSSWYHDAAIQESNYRREH